MTNAERALDVVRRGDATRPFVVAQLGQSLDGRIALPSGESKYINGPAALDHLHRLRAAVDAVIVGIGTVTADDPQLTVRRVDGREPRSHRHRSEWTSPCPMPLPGGEWRAGLHYSAARLPRSRA